MSPELLETETQDNRRTKYSDPYALGMVIYEVLSGRVPFHPYRTWSIPMKVLRGDRPGRPQGAEGAWFTDDVWQVPERCWTAQPKDRPSVEGVLQCLNQSPSSWTRPSLPRVAVPPLIDSLTTNPFKITDEWSVGVDESNYLPRFTHRIFAVER